MSTGSRKTLLFEMLRNPQEHAHQVTVAVAIGCMAYLLSQGGEPFSRAREKMVSEQIEARGIRESNVLRAMRLTPATCLSLPPFNYKPMRTGRFQSAMALPFRSPSSSPG